MPGPRGAARLRAADRTARSARAGQPACKHACPARVVSTPPHPLALTTPPPSPSPLPHPTAVARELTKRGFSRVFVVQGGCKGWVEAKLRTRPWRPAGLLPSSVEKWGQHGSGSNGRVEVEVTP